MFSVLLSVYSKDNPLYLEQSLGSIINQTLVSEDIIIVEDGPLTKELYDVLDYFENKCKFIKRVPLKVNSGLGKALNEGLILCSYDLVARMDSDDIAYPDRFEKQVKFMNEHPEIDACSSWIDEFEDSIENVTSIKKLPETSEEIMKYARHRCPLNHPAVVYRKKAVMNVGGYWGFPEDYNLWARMLMNGSLFYNFQESLLYFRYSSDMIKRRGGWKYAKSDIISQYEFYKIGFSGLVDFIYNVTIRTIVRLIPHGLRHFVYKKTLRK